MERERERKRERGKCNAPPGCNHLIAEARKADEERRVK